MKVLASQQASDKFAAGILEGLSVMCGIVGAVAQRDIEVLKVYVALSTGTTQQVLLSSMIPKSPASAAWEK